MDETLDPNRRLDIEGAHNVRDLGGYRTRDGNSTRWLRFLRADTLHRLSPAVRIALVDYGVRTIIDLRQTNETRAEPNVFAHSAEVAYHHLNMIGDEPLGIEPAPGEADRPQQIAHGYCGYLDKRQAQVNRIPATLARAENQAALYHCAADMAERYNNPARQPMPIL